MNITHAVHEEVTGDKLQAIFQRQKDLWDKYHHIEVKSGLRITEDCPVNLNDRRGQFQLKDYAWRIMEELGEAVDAMNDFDHHVEELIDGLHFLTEMTILAGKDWDTLEEDVMHKDRLDDLVERARGILSPLYEENLSPARDILPRMVTLLVKELGMMCNCLKNKPWKQSMMITDEAVFYYQLQKVWEAYTAILVNAGMNSEGICDTYLRKSQVNQFRQRSNY